MTTSTGAIEWHPVTYVTEPRGGHVMVLRDHWWATNGEGQIAIATRETHRRGDTATPQCNASKAIADMMGQRIGATGSVLLPLAFFPMDMSDYRY